MNDRSAAPVRRSTLEGTWYPAALDDWRRDVPLLFEDRAGASVDDVRAIVVPHAGVRYSGQTAAHAYRATAGEGPRVVVVFGPSHYHAFAGASAQPAAGYETPFGVLEAAEDVRRELVAAGVLHEEAAAHAREHSVEIQLPFLRATSPKARVLPVVLGRLEESFLAELADALVQAVPESALFVASTDFTHYGDSFGYHPTGPGHPRDVVGAIDRRSFECLEHRDRVALRQHRAESGTTICGAMALELLLEVSSRLDLDPELLDYQTSGDLVGDWHSSVSYGSFALHDGARLTEDERATLQEAARRTIVAASENGTRPERLDPTLSLVADRGAFVTLRRDGELRACMGHLAGQPDLASAVLEAAWSAARRDPRFEPVQPGELRDLDFEITVLTQPVRMEDPLDLELGVHGVVLEVDGRRATFLPQVALDHGLDREGLWVALCRKAGVDETRWRDAGARHYRYRGEVVGPVPVLSSAS